MTSVLMVAAENGLLPNLKVGGIADVVSGLSQALVELGHQVTVVTPGYGLFDSARCTHVGELSDSFGGGKVTAELLRPPQSGAVESLVIEHPRLRADGQIYVHDADHPFATDATRFALFSSLAASLIRTSDVDVVHLHDWHAAAVGLLRGYSVRHRKLKAIRTLYTIHNLALQGIRPLHGMSSSLSGWYPGMSYPQTITDPRWPDCINLMRTGLKLSDHVTTVSETYADEIQLPDEASRGYHGGEGLHRDLKDLARSGRLSGILNGCDYTTPAAGAALEPANLVSVLRSEILRMAADDTHMRSSYVIALENLQNVDSDNVACVVTSVGRTVRQKLALLMETRDGISTLQRMLQAGGPGTLFVMLGTGEPEVEQFLARTAAANENLIYIGGYSAAIADALYASGQLFIMPSLFEPCGLSQMLAMRAGQPCLVHDTGGLKDTVADERTGWKFDGDTLADKADNLLQTFTRILPAVQGRTPAYVKIARAAGRCRFTWDASAQAYAALYQADSASGVTGK